MAAIGIGSPAPMPAAPSGARAGQGGNPPPPLRVCADPNNLPFSNRAGEGFENALARLVARELGRPLGYTWWPQRRGFMRTTLNAGACDVVMGVPANFEMALTTIPYYRSAYAFVTRHDRHLRISSFDDPRLRTLRLGVHVIGDDYASVPPAQVLSDRHIVKNVRGFSIYGDYGKPNPPAALIEAVRDGDIDVAIAWGPLAGFFGAQGTPPLDVTPAPERDRTRVQLAFDISMGVRRSDKALKQVLDELLTRRREEVRAILSRFHVPQSGPASTRKSEEAEASAERAEKARGVGMNPTPF